jgi:predicted amidohydrolase
MQSLTVAVVQSGLYPKDERRAVCEAVSFARKAAQRSARLVCFPEHWLLEKVLSPEDDLYGNFSDLARELDLYINLGGIFDSSESKTFFLSPTISPDGKIISKQKKVHLFRRENDIAIGGNSFDPFKIDGINVGVMVCHDVVFPESARTLVLKGAEVILNPSLITALGIEPWRAYIKARVLENRVPIIAANPFLRNRVPGGSVLMGLKYEKAQGIMEIHELVKSSTGKRMYVSKLSFSEETTALREERLSERKPEAYFKD